MSGKKHFSKYADNEHVLQLISRNGYLIRENVFVKYRNQSLHLCAQNTDFHCHGKLHKNYSYSMKRNRTCQSCDLATLTISLENIFVDKRFIELFEMEQKS